MSQRLPDYDGYRAREKAKHVITIKGDRVDIKCQNCGDSMDVSATSALGAAMLENWPKLHKCTKKEKP